MKTFLFVVHGLTLVRLECKMSNTVNAQSIPKYGKALSNIYHGIETTIGN